MGYSVCAYGDRHFLASVRCNGRTLQRIGCDRGGLESWAYSLVLAACQRGVRA